LGFTITPALSENRMMASQINHWNEGRDKTVETSQNMKGLQATNVKKYMSHGQSQSFIAAMPLPKAMEYETTFKWRKTSKIKIPKGEPLQIKI
jgi:hypothetical protein